MTRRAIVDKVLSPRTTMTPSAPFWIRSLEVSECDHGYLTAAIRSVSQVADELGMDPVSLTVTLFARCAPGDDDATLFRHGAINGLATASMDGAVFLSAHLSAAQLMDTCAHETRHVWQFRQNWRAFHTREFLEHDAREFGRTWAKRRLREEWQQQKPGEPVPKAFV
jgi:hypothetical protein